MKKILKVYVKASTVLCHRKLEEKGCSVRLAVLNDSNLNLVADKTMTQLYSFISRGEIESFFAQNYPRL